VATDCGALSLHFEGTNAQQESADEGDRNRIDSLSPFRTGVSGKGIVMR
jgi:hypothetical protein